MFKYRPDEGVYARGTAFWSLASLAFFGGRRFFFWSQRWDFSRKDLLGDPLPILAFPLTPGFLMGVALFTIFAWGIWRLLNAQKIGDLLIETELEMKKVTWPSFTDSRKSSFVVILCVAIMVVFLAATDFSLQWFFFHVVYGQGK
jgi:preprotein translocase SecE subunit